MGEPVLPVLVVGAGPTGLMVANELARHGVAPRIIDRGPAPSTTSRALVVQPRTLEIFDDIGVTDHALAAGAPPAGPARPPSPRCVGGDPPADGHRARERD